MGFPSEEYQTCGKGPTSHVLYRIKRDICGQTYPTGPVFLLKFRDLDMPSDLHPADFTSFIAASVSSSSTFPVSNSGMVPSHPQGAGRTEDECTLLPGLLPAGNSTVMAHGWPGDGLCGGGQSRRAVQSRALLWDRLSAKSLCYKGLHLSH